MRIGGIEKQSQIDWEGKTVAVLFTRGCNYRCGYCHNPGLVYPKLFAQSPDLPLESVFHFLEERMGWLDGVVISGGEPTLHQDLKWLTQQIKAMGFAVKLDTNGSRPDVLEELIQLKLIDYVAMDIKTRLNAKLYNEICGTQDPDIVNKVRQSLHILRKYKLPYQLRTTILPDHHSIQMIEELKQQFKDEDYRLQEYREPLT